MKKTILFSFLILAVYFVQGQSCGFDHIHQKQLNNPDFAILVQQAEAKIQSVIAKKSALSKSASSLLTIPIVVHVMHLGENIGQGSNISDAQIQSSIDNLNDFYGGFTSNSPIDFEIQFVLAKRDPNCNATTGINRIDASGVTGYSQYGVNNEESDGADDTVIKALSKWPETDYFNIWIVTEIDNNNGGSGIQGYANFYNGLTNEGAVMMSTVFGYDPGNTNGWGLNSNGDNSTTIHEVGHYFHLYHTFQGDNEDEDDNYDDCPLDTTVGTNSDGCADTVPHKRETSTCPAQNDCTMAAWIDNNTINNVMSYYSCVDRLTSDQKIRVRAAMEGTSLVASSGGIDPDPTYAAPVAVCNANEVTTNASGILSVNLNGKTFSSGSSASDGGNIDNSDSCSNYFEIDTSNNYNLSVDVYIINFQQLGVWIDWNDDGDFNDDNEQQYLQDDIPSSSQVSFQLSYPSSIPYGDYVRLRLITDVDDRYTGAGLINSACYSSLDAGQSEDYAIYVQPQVLSVTDNVFNNIIVFVNQDQDQLVIKGELSQPTTAKLYDINGRLMFEKRLNVSSRKNNISTSLVSSGIYLVKLDNGLQRETRKIIIH